MTEGSDYETDPVRVVNYNASHTSFNPTVHIVAEEREAEAVTACGRTLSTVDTFGSKGGWVGDLGEKLTGDRCGNCPWDEVEDDG